MIKSIYFLRKVPIVGSLGGILLKNTTPFVSKQEKSAF